MPWSRLACQGSHDVHGAVEDAALAAMLLQALHGYERMIHPPVVGLHFQDAHGA
jgi:hypothetical protein